MRCEEFFETNCIEIIDEIIQEQAWHHGCNTEEMFKELKAQAALSGTKLIDLDYWDYDKFFYNLYKITEKGLS